MPTHPTVQQAVHAIVTVKNGLSVTLAPSQFSTWTASHPWEPGWDELVAKGTIGLAIVTVLAVFIPIYIEWNNKKEEHAGVLRAIRQSLRYSLERIEIIVGYQVADSIVGEQIKELDSIAEDLKKSLENITVQTRLNDIEYRSIDKFMREIKVAISSMKTSYIIPNSSKGVTLATTVKSRVEVYESVTKLLESIVDCIAILKDKELSEMHKSLTSDTKKKLTDLAPSSSNE